MNNQTIKSGRAITQTEKSINREIDMSKLLSASQNTGIEDDTKMLSITLNNTREDMESKLIDADDDKDVFEDGVNITSTQKDNDEGNNAKISELKEKSKIQKILMKIRGKKSKT